MSAGAELVWKSSRRRDPLAASAIPTAPLLAASHQNLQLLSNALYDRVRALMTARYGSVARTVRNAALLMPLWRLFRRGGLLFKIGLGILVIWMVNSVLALVASGSLASAVLMYAVYVAVAFFIERYLILKAPLATLKKSAAEFKNLRLAYVFADQRPEHCREQKRV